MEAVTVQEITRVDIGRLLAVRVMADTRHVTKIRAAHRQPPWECEWTTMLLLNTDGMNKVIVG